MNRRYFLAGAAAVAAHPNVLWALPGAHGAASNASSRIPHQNLLAHTFPENLLASRLVSIEDWNPYPRYSEREPWEKIPDDIRAIYLDRAEKTHVEGWEVLTATEFLDFKRTGNRNRYEKREFGRRDKLLQLVLAECMEGQGRFVDDIANGVWLICEESFWGVPAHLPGKRSGPGLPEVAHPTVELFGAETGALLAWTKYLLSEQLDRVSPVINKRIRLEAKKRLLDPTRESNDFWWMGLDRKAYPDVHLSNWNPWINSNLLIVNLLLEDDPRLRLQETVKITRSLDAYLNEYSPDGGCEEGPHYWTRSAASYFECVNTLQLATGHSTNIFQNPFLNEMGRYIANIHIAKDYYADYGDSAPKEHPPGDVIYRYGNAVGDRQFAAFGVYCAKRRGAAATGEGLAQWVDRGGQSASRYLPAVLEAGELRKVPQHDALARDSWYPDLALMTAREKADSAQGMYLAVQAASNGRGHGHNDSGSFVLYYNGEPIVIDPGVGTYSAKTFGALRYGIWSMQSAYHNLPTVGGVMQRHGDPYKAKSLAYHSDNARTTLFLDLAPAYPQEAGIQVWKRRLTLDRTQGRILVEEDFHLTRSVPVSLTIMTPGAPETVSSGTLRLTSIANQGMPVFLKYDDVQLQPVVEKISLTNAGMRAQWGSELYRIRLDSKHAVSQGKWAFEFLQRA